MYPCVLVCVYDCACARVCTCYVRELYVIQFYTLCSSSARLFGTLQFYPFTKTYDISGYNYSSVINSAVTDLQFTAESVNRWKSRITEMLDLYHKQSRYQNPTPSLSCYEPELAVYS